MNNAVRTRFAPSPTGYLHIGNAHTALFAWLFARRSGGTFVLRIEDTDRERSQAQYETALLEDLAWLGLDWDEGPDRGGAHGPYRQTERLEIYREYADRLLAEGKAYRCYCRAEELEAKRQAALAEGRPPRYDGRCRDLSPEQEAVLARECVAEGREPAIRFRRNGGGVVVVHDLIRGETSFDLADLDDFLLIRPNGWPLYNFAVTVDDLTMGITHVIRADEHIANTPRQVLLFDAFGLQPPVFAHIPMLVGPGGAKLSKRLGATSVREYREQGYLPEAVRNYLALLGWSDPEGTEILSLPQLTERFSLARVGHSPSAVDPARLDWMNAHYLRLVAPERVADLARPFLQAAGLPDKGERVKRALSVVTPDLRRLCELPDMLRPYLAPLPDPLPAEAIKQLGQPVAAAALAAAEESLVEVTEAAWAPGTIEVALHAAADATGVGVGKAFRPVRAALTGRASGPELPKVAWMLGRAETLARLACARHTVE